MRLELGSAVHCADGHFGELADVVVDPGARRVTHLVVAPRHRRADARLVPVALARPGRETEELELDATIAAVKALDAPWEASYVRLGEVPTRDPDWDVGIKDAYVLPSFIPADGFGSAPADMDPHIIVRYDRVPKGAVEIRRSSTVVSAEGHVVGHTDGFLVTDGERISHVLLEHGHLWGHREVAIPIADVASIDSDAVRLRLSREGLGRLASVRVRRRP